MTDKSGKSNFGHILSIIEVTMYWKLGLLIGLIGFLGVGALLYSGHPGVAIKVINWLFPILFLGTLAGLLARKN